MDDRAFDPGWLRRVATYALGFAAASLVAERVLYAELLHPRWARPGAVTPLAFVVLYLPVLGVCVRVAAIAPTARERLLAAALAGLAGAGAKALCAVADVDGFLPLPGGLATLRLLAVSAARMAVGYAAVLTVLAAVIARLRKGRPGVR